jgi:hypothetical protein
MLSREKLEPENVVSGYIYPDIINDPDGAGQGRLVPVPRREFISAVTDLRSAESAAPKAFPAFSFRLT